MTQSAPPTLVPVERRRLVVLGLARAVGSATVLLLLYSVAPFDRLDGVPVPVTLLVALVVLLCVTVWQVRSIIRSANPGVRGIEALGVTAPLFLLLFAACYYVMARDDPSSFDPSGLTRSDTLYFTVTTFATVGYGDIVATSQVARRIVTFQMFLDLLVLGFGIRVFVGAVQRGRKEHHAGPDAGR